MIIQVWCAISLISTIRHRIVLIRLLHLGATTRCTLYAAQQAHSTILQTLQLTSQQQKACKESEEKLRSLEL